MKPELTDRKLQILAAVVREYSETGEPVGSKSLAADLNLSSATIRNEMSELAELGLLEQPHTSAGRVPTAKGYRLYVNQLMHRQPLSERDKREIDDMLPGQVEDPGVLAEAAARALAELTDCAAVTTTPADDQATVKQVRVLPLSRQTVVVAALTSSGLMKSRICLVEGGVTPDMLEKFIRFAEEQLYGLPLSDFQQGLTQTLAVQMGAANYGGVAGNACVGSAGGVVAARAKQSFEAQAVWWGTGGASAGIFIQRQASVTNSASSRRGRAGSAGKRDWRGGAGAFRAGGFALPRRGSGNGKHWSDRS